MRPELPVLIKARAKIADPANWGKGTRGYADGQRPLSTRCAAEAIEDVIGPGEIGLAASAGRAIKKVTQATSIVDWNDAPERTHAEVLAAFDRAIESAS